MRTMSHLHSVSICLSLSYNGHEISIFAALFVSGHYSIYKSYPRMRSKHHDSKIQGDFLPPYMLGHVAQLHCHTQENGDSSIPHNGIRGIVSGQCCQARQQDLGPAELDTWGEPAPVHPWNEGDGNSSGAEHLKTHTDSLAGGNIQQYLEADVSAPLLSSQRHCMVIWIPLLQSRFMYMESHNNIMHRSHHHSWL